MASTTQPGGRPAPPRPEIFAQLDKFWQRVTDGLELGQLWKQFHADARSSYRLYHKDFSAQAPREAKSRSFFATAQEFAWAILEKLTPARRVLLLLGVLLLIFPAGGFSYHGKADEVEVVEFDFHFFGGALLFILLMLEIADRVVMKRDLEIARDIQGWLLPPTPPAIPGFAVAFATRPANTVAGDFYDVFQRPLAGPAESKFLLAICDVAGKSIPAALLMATFQASLKTLSATPSSLGELVAAMNRYACSSSQNGLRFTTAFIAELTPSSKSLTYINAGHNAPLLLRASGQSIELSDGGLPLGIKADAPYESGTVILESNDWLVAFTDGVIEAMNRTGEEYGQRRLISVINSGRPATPDEMLRRLMSNLDAFVQETPQHDDITCMLLKAA